MRRFNISFVCLTLFTLCDCQALAYNEIKISEDSYESFPLKDISFTDTTEPDITTEWTSGIPTEFTTPNTDEVKLTTSNDVEMFSTKGEETGMPTSETSDVNYTTTVTIMTSETESTTITTSDFVTDSFTKQTDLITTLGVPLGLGIPALLIVIGGLFYHYRRGQRLTKALFTRTNPNEIPMTETDA